MINELNEEINGGLLDEQLESQNIKSSLKNEKIKQEENEKILIEEEEEIHEEIEMKDQEIQKDEEIQKEEEIKDAEEKNEKADIKEEKAEEKRVSKEELEKKEVQEFFRELLEEEPLEGVLHPPIENEKEQPKKEVIQTPQKKPKIIKPKIEDKPLVKIIVKKKENKKHEESLEDQLKRETAQFLSEINAGDEDGQLFLSSSGKNSRPQSKISEKENINKKKEKPKKIELNQKSPKINIVQNKKNEKVKKPDGSHQEDDINKEVKELFKQFEEMQEEGVLKPNQNQTEKPPSQLSKEKPEAARKEKVRPPSKQKDQSSSPRSKAPSFKSVPQQTAQEVNVFNEKEEVRELFRQMAEEPLEGVLHPSSSEPQPPRAPSESSKKKEKVVKEPKSPKLPKPTENEKVKKHVPVHNTNNEPQLSPEELEKQELKEFFRQLEEELVEATLQPEKEKQISREPSVLSKKSVKSTKSIKSVKSTSEQSQRVDKSKQKQLIAQQASQNLPKETLEEQERRELREFYKQLDEAEEEGLLHLSDERSFSRQSTTSKQKERSPSRLSISSKQKDRTISKASASSKQKGSSVKH